MNNLFDTPRSEQYKAGFNARVTDANTKLPRLCKKNDEWFAGWYAACELVTLAICENIATGKPMREIETFTIS